MAQRNVGFMGTKEAAQLWGVKPATVRKWCKEKEIVVKARKDAGGRWLIPIGAERPKRKLNNTVGA